ncbi:MAG TPA: ATP-binding protein [Bryobacteraceae bacterium]|nr:ATP-binding protein [Bryobacteraceae bacterium]
MPSNEEAPSEQPRTRVLILAPVGRDAALACGVLNREQLTAEVCPNVPDLIAKLQAGAGTAVIADEALNGNIPLLQDWVKSQPAWSDFPFIILTGTKALPGKMQERFALMEPLGNITLLERPLRSITLLTVVRAALRARLRQYEVEHYITETRQAEADKAQAYAGKEAAQAQIELLNHVGEILSAELNLDTLLPAIIEAGTDLSGADIGIFFSEGIVEGVRKFALRCAAGLPLAEASVLLGPDALMDGTQFSWKRLLRCSELGDSPFDINDAWIHAVAHKLSLSNCIALPVMSRLGAVLGVVFFGRRRPEPFSERDESVASSLASQAAIAIDNARLFSMAEQERKRLEAARQILQRSNEELRQFAYVASHDLQEPLRTVASFTQLLVSRYGTLGDSDAVEFVAYIVDAVERMSSLIHDLLQYSSTGGSRTLPSAPTSAEGALAEVLFALSASIQHSGAVITYDHLPEVWVENRSLITLLQNLLSNAIKYRSEDPPRIHVSAAPAGANWRFSVRDNGIGIAPEYHERIFGIFKRLHGKEIPGTGIGLAICQRIVQWHGGDIGVESEGGPGSVFYFTLPKEPQRIQREMAEFASLGAKS